MCQLASIVIVCLFVSRQSYIVLCHSNLLYLLLEKDVMMNVGMVPWNLYQVCLFWSPPENGNEDKYSSCFILGDPPPEMEMLTDLWLCICLSPPEKWKWDESQAPILLRKMVVILNLTMVWYSFYQVLICPLVILFLKMGMMVNERMAGLFL